MTDAPPDADAAAILELLSIYAAVLRLYGLLPDLTRDGETLLFEAIDTVMATLPGLQDAIVAAPWPESLLDS